ncbi:MAG: hypothetical protein AB8G99_26330, partial [Planctomycetaceae bacterium]
MIRYLRHTCLGFMGLALLCSWVPNASGQIAAEPEGMTLEQRRNRMVSFAEREMTLELIRLVAIDGAFEELRPKLYQAGEPAATKAGEARAKNKKLPTFVLRNFPDRRVAKALADMAESLVSEKIAKMYLKDVADRRTFFDAAYTDLLVGMLDQQVNLTPKQAAQIGARLKNTSWFSFTHPHLHHYDWSWGIKPPAEFLTMDLPELTKSQRDGWVMRTKLLQALPTHTNLDDDFDEFKSRCQKAIAFKIRILAEQYELTAASSRRLELAGKGVTTKLAAAWRDAWATRTQQDRGPVWLSSNREFTQFTDLFDLIESHSDWHRRVLSVLSKQHRKTYNEWLAVRAQRAHDAAWRCWVVCWSLRMGLTAKQERDLFQLVSTQLPVDPTGTRASHANWERLGSIPMTAFEKAIGKDQ